MVLLLKFLLLLCSVVVVAVDPIGLPSVDTVVVLLLLGLGLGECNRLWVCDTDSCRCGSAGLLTAPGVVAVAATTVAAVVPVVVADPTAC